MLTRRDLLRLLSALPVVGTAAVACRRGLEAAPSAPSLPLLNPGAQSSKVVIVRHDHVMDPAGGIRRGLIQRMVDTAMVEMTGAPDPAAAWKMIVTPRDMVGLKVNTIASESKGPCTQPALVDAVVAGLRSAGLPAENIIIWDRQEEELTTAGFRIYRGPSGVQCFGTDSLGGLSEGYVGGMGKAESFNCNISRILAEATSVLINMPVLKDHSIAGVTFGMKNLYGIIDGASTLHEEVHKAPYIPDLVALPVVKSKYRLTIGDMTRCMCDGGPFGRGNHGIFQYGGIMVGTDPVAMDAVGAEIIAKERDIRGLPSLEKLGRPPLYIDLAAKRGLGRADKGAIDLREITLKG